MPTTTRRRFLHLTGVTALAAIAGCSDGGGSETPTETETPARTETVADVGTETVPEPYRTAKSQGGTRRNPGALSSKESVNYQTEPKDGKQCSGCQYFIPNEAGNGTGACAIVAGPIDPNGYCVSYVAYEG